jgi:hypothetical protein
MEATMQQTPTLKTGPLGHLERWWRNWKAGDAARQELAGCGDNETAHIARDIGVSTSELRTLAGRWPDSANLLERRIATLGLAPVAYAEPETVRDLQRVCGQCASEARYERDLDSDERDRAWRDYCPSAATLDALRTDERDRRLLRRRRKWRSF